MAQKRAGAFRTEQETCQGEEASALSSQAERGAGHRGRGGGSLGYWLPGVYSVSTAGVPGASGCEDASGLLCGRPRQPAERLPLGSQPEVAGPGPSLHCVSLETRLCSFAP